MAACGLFLQGAVPGYLVALAAWALLVYFQVRAGLDAELLEWLAGGLAAEELDTFLVRAGLIQSAAARTIADRCAGARRLWFRLLVSLVVELVALGAGITVGLR